MRQLALLSMAATSVRRGLRQGRGTLVVAVLTLAAAIGMNVAVLGLVSRALLTPPAGLADPEHLLSLAFERTIGDGSIVRQATTSWPAYRQLATDVASVAGAAAWQRGPAGVVVDGEQRPAETLLVSDSYFDVLGARPRLGPGFQAGDTGPAVVISHHFWRTAFGGDAAVLGQRVSLRGKVFEVAGVMPAGFTGHAAAVVDAWFPIDRALADSPGWDLPLRNIVSVFVRVREGEGTGFAAQATSALGQRIVASPLAGGSVPAQDRQIAWWLAGVSALVLLIGLANAGTLLVVRASRHQRETAVRVALGASRSHLLAHVAGEALVIGLSAGAASLLFGRLLDDTVRGVLLTGIAPAPAWDARVVAGAALAGLIASVVVFAAGAMQLRVARRAGLLRSQAPSGAGFQRILLLVQVSVSVLLLAGAGMFGRALHGLTSQDLGMDLDALLVVDFEQGPGSVPGQDELFVDALAKVRALPGVTAATVYQAMPFGGFHVPPIAVPGRAEPPQVGGQLPFLLAATPEFMNLMGIRIVEGRPFTASDEGGPLVVIVNETMARGVWPGESAVGKCIRIGFDPEFDPYTAQGPPVPSAAVPCREVIGVARDVRQRSIVPTGSEAALMQYYVPFPQVPLPPMAAGAGPHVNGLLVRTSGDSAVVAAAVRRLVSSGRDDLPFVRVRPYTELFARQVRPWRLGTTLLSVFGALAVCIAAVGLYAAFAHRVTTRRREMAIRLAIGATAGSVRGLVLRDAAVLTFAGAAAGACGAIFAGRSIGAVLYGISGTDGWALAGAMLLMMGIAALATLVPAVTAARSDPNTLLRAE
jgi:putative ABC transport system permease protein